MYKCSNGYGSKCEQNNKTGLISLLTGYNLVRTFIQGSEQVHSIASNYTYYVSTPPPPSLHKPNRCTMYFKLSSHKQTLKAIDLRSGID